MNLDDLRQQLASMAREVSDTETTTRLRGVEGKVRTARRTRAITAGLAAAAVVAVGGVTAPQFLGTADPPGPASPDQLATTQLQPATVSTPTESNWTPVGEQAFVDNPDNRPPAINLRRVQVRNGRDRLAVTVHVANLQPGRAAFSLLVTDSTAKASSYTATDAYRVDAYQAADGTMHGGLYRHFSDPEDGKPPVKCGRLSVREFTDARSLIHVTIPKSCVGDIEGPLRLWVGLRTPGVEGGAEDELQPQPAVVQ